MNRLDRLILKAKTIATVELYLAEVDYRDGSWVAVGHIADRLHRHPDEVRSCRCESLEAALAYIHELAEKYPNSQDIGILVDDL